MTRASRTLFLIVTTLLLTHAIEARAQRGGRGLTVGGGLTRSAAPRSDTSRPGYPQREPGAVVRELGDGCDTEYDDRVGGHRSE